MKQNPAIASIVKGFLFWWIFDSCLLLVFACAIEMHMLPIDSAQLLALVSVIITTSIGSYLVVKNSGVQANGYCLSGTVLASFVVAVFLVHRLDGFNGMMVKIVVAMFVGTIFGNLLGIKRYNKRKNASKKRKRITK